MVDLLERVGGDGSVIWHKNPGGSIACTNTGNEQKTCLSFGKTKFSSNFCVWGTKATMKHNVKEALSLVDLPVSTEALFWINFTGWNSCDDIVVNIHNHFEILPEYCPGKPYRWRHKRGRLGFEIAFAKVSVEKIKAFEEKRQNYLRDLKTKDKGAQLKVKFMAKSPADGLWYRATIVGPMSSSHLTTSSASNSKRKPRKSPAPKLTNSFSMQATVLGQRYTIFCRDIFEQLKRLTQDTLLAHWTEMIEGETSTVRLSTACDERESAGLVRNILENPRIGLLCALSHDMTVPLKEQLAGVLVYKCHSTATVPFVEILTCVVPQKFAAGNLAHKLIGAVKGLAKKQRYAFLAAFADAWPRLGNLSNCPRAVADLETYCASSTQASIPQQSTIRSPSPFSALLHETGFKILERSLSTRSDSFSLQSWVVARDTMTKLSKSADSIQWLKLIQDGRQ